MRPVVTGATHQPLASQTRLHQTVPLRYLWHRLGGGSTGVGGYPVAMSLKSDPSAWTDPRHLRGLEGEQVAMRYLHARGWRVLEHRFRMGRLEIDVIARLGQLVAFIEVKTRWSARFGSPLQAVTWAKRREITRVAQAWIARHGRADDAYRFDVIGVTLSRWGRVRVDHLEDAFRVGWR